MSRLHKVVKEFESTYANFMQAACGTHPLCSLSSSIPEFARFSEVTLGHTATLCVPALPQKRQATAPGPHTIHNLYNVGRLTPVSRSMT